MKFRWKIFLVCMSIYIVTLACTSIIVTEDTFKGLINKEIERALREQKNIHDSTMLYLVSIQSQKEETLKIEEYSNRIIQMFSGEKEFIEIYNKKEEIIASNFNIKIKQNREELSRVLVEGRNYVVREQDDIHYLFITDTIMADKDELILCYIRNIEEVYNQRIEQYLTFFRVALIGLIFIAFVALLISKVILKPIAELSKAVNCIASGNFNERVTVKGKDEVANLGKQFNLMASEIEMKVSELNKEAEQKQRFIDNLTHELRTPLTSVIGYSEFLQKIKYEEINFAKGLNYIYSEGKRMLKLINSLMNMIILRENIVNLEETNVLNFLEDISNIIKVRADEAGIRIVVKGEQSIFKIDRDLIKQVILNLIDNSIKASKEGDMITLGVQVSKNECIIYVEDEGKGIEEEEIVKITEPFYRVEKSRSRKAGGAGLGLSLCKEIVNKHDGQLLIESILNKGTKVSIIFPKKDKGDVNIA